MRVDIRPQWNRLARWYWNSFDSDDGGGMSVWEMLNQEYGAFQVATKRRTQEILVDFPDEKLYTAFLLKWT